MSRTSIRPYVKEFYPEYYSWHTYPADQCAVLTKVDQPWGVLTNFGNLPLTVGGVVFKNSEQLFHLMKFTAAEPLLDIYRASGQTIKMKAKKKIYDPYRRPDWGRMIVDAMKFCLMTKYEQCEAFRNELQNTQGLYIVERCANPTRKRGDTWSAVLHDGVYEGSNLMGRLLMELRDNGKLEYHLPDDAMDFIEVIKQSINK